MSKQKISTEIDLLLHILDEGYSKRAWHGPTLLGSIKGLAMEDASWRASNKRHNIWEIIVHCAYWKYIARKRITGERKGTFPLKGSNWFLRPVEMNEKSLHKDIALLDGMHSMLIETVKTLELEDLPMIANGGKASVRETIIGVAMHDVYHAGQIQLLKHLFTETR